MFIYKVTNKVNGKVYVGKTVRPMKARWSQHLADVRRGSDLLFHRATRKYGAEQFDVAMSEQKRLWWAQRTERTTLSLRGKPKSDEHRRKLSEAKKAPIVERICPICTVVFMVPDKVRSKKCCSRKCASVLSNITIKNRRLSY